MCSVVNESSSSLFIKGTFKDNTIKERLTVSGKAFGKCNYLLKKNTKARDRQKEDS